MAKRHAGLIACNKMAQAIRSNCMGEFWKQTRRFRKHEVNHYKTVDGIEGEHEIAGLFSLKYKELLNTVSYDEEVTTRLQNNIDDSIISECASCTGCDTSYDPVLLHPKSLML